jgi:hypothetical protein
MTTADYAALVTAHQAAEVERHTSLDAEALWLELGRKLMGARRERQDAKYHAHLGDTYPCSQFERGVDEGLL